MSYHFFLGVQPSSPFFNSPLCPPPLQTMCDMNHVSGNDYDIQIISEGGDCLQAWGKPKRWRRRRCGGGWREGGGLSFINSPAVVATPCWTVNHQWPQNYRHGSPADSKNCLLTAIYGPASRAGPPLSLASPRCAHILTSWRH